MFRFDIPQAFLLVIIIAAVMGYYYLKKRKPGIRFSSLKNAAKVPVSIRQRLAIIPILLRCLGFLFIVFALARPQQGKELVRDLSRGVAIELVVDRSGSMSAQKDFAGKSFTRLDIVKQVFEEFVSGNDKGLAGRPYDLIGMITFARYADTVCPLTLSHGALLRFNENVQIVQVQEEDGTSIGDAIVLAAARLKTTENTLTEQADGEESDYSIKSKVIILLTDGQDTGIGQRTPLEGAEIAKEWGIKIYTIGITGEGWYIIQDTIIGKRKVPYPSQFDSSVLDRIAGETNGIFRTADDIDSLRDIYKEIDALEKSEIESIRYLEYKELFLPFIIAAIISLACEIILSTTVFRRIP